MTLRDDAEVSWSLLEEDDDPEDELDEEVEEEDDEDDGAIDADELDGERPPDAGPIRLSKYDG